MTKKIESKVLEGNLRWKKIEGKPSTLEGEITIGFNCDTYCRKYHEVRQTFPNNGTNQVHKCEICGEEYLIEIEAKNPISHKVGDKKSVELYRQTIPVLQKIRGVHPQDEINLGK